jgi:hypothetical protein
MTTLRVEDLWMPGVQLGAENPLPHFRDRSTDRAIAAHASLPDKKRQLLGWETGLRVLPYRMQDNYSRQRALTCYRSVVLENDILRATFLPELGGRLVSLLHKPEGRELVCRNPVFQPANLAIRNAWFSGGIEWNIGQLGHTFSTCSALFAACIPGLQGEPALRLYDFERCKQLFWQMDFFLPEGCEWLIAHTRILNLNDFETSTYWWTNIAIPEGRDIRVLAPARQAIYDGLLNDGCNLALSDLPELPGLNGKDASYALNSDFANEFFFQCDETDLPWEAALDREGCGLIEASTPRLRYRKLFCWGRHPGGRHWQEFLAPGGKPYLEIQAGLAPTQLHGLQLPARTAWDWTQIFGCLHADPVGVHATDWNLAWQSVDSNLRQRMTPAHLQKLESACRERMDTAPTQVLMNGSGWGTLEAERRRLTPGSMPVPDGLVFPGSSLTREQDGWLNLLHNGCLPEQRPEDVPGEWMVQGDFCALLEHSLEEAHNRNWYAYLHLGVMRLEHFDEAGAQAAWQASIQLEPSAWAYRNLAVLASFQNDGDRALDCFERAWELDSAHGRSSLALAQEYLQALCKERHYAQAQTVYAGLPQALQMNDRLRILNARVALELGDLPTAEKILQYEFAVVREGETELTDIWFEIWYKRFAAASDTPLDENARAEIRRLYPPPAQIDFRSVNR